MMKLVIGHLYPDLLNLYGDRGNTSSASANVWNGVAWRLR